MELFDFGAERPIFHMMAATFETLAHLHLLMYDDKVERIEVAGAVQFTAV